MLVAKTSDGTMKKSRLVVTQLLRWQLSQTLIVVSSIEQLLEMYEDCQWHA